MRLKHVLVTLVFAGLLLAGTGFAGDLSKEDVAALEAMSLGFAKAMNERDLDAVAAFYAEDALFMPPNMPAVMGRKAIREFMENFPQVKDMTLEHVKIMGSGDVVTIAGKWTMTMVMGEKSIADTGHFLDTRVRQKDGSWAYAADMFSSDQPMEHAH